MLLWNFARALVCACKREKGPLVYEMRHGYGMVLMLNWAYWSFFLRLVARDEHCDCSSSRKAHFGWYL